MSASRKQHLTEARAHARSRKQSAKAKARQSHKHETPRSQRIRGNTPAILGNFEKTITWFDLMHAQKRIAA